MSQLCHKDSERFLWFPDPGVELEALHSFVLLQIHFFHNISVDQVGLAGATRFHTSSLCKCSEEQLSSCFLFDDEVEGYQFHVVIAPGILA